MNQPYPISIYYDRTCPLYNQEMSRLKQHDPDGKLILIDCSDKNFISPEGAPPTADMMTLLHVRTAEGAWVVGVPAFRLAYAGVGFHFVTDWLDKPYINRLMTRLYPLIARHRYVFPEWLAEAWFNWLAAKSIQRSQACNNGQCNI
jgi:predicted DCC family thiol-disulfide oxidoreductase YuxK